MGGLAPPQDRYVEMIAAASGQLVELIDLLSLAARIESGRYEPELRDVESDELARAAAGRIAEGRARAEGEGAIVRVEPIAAEHALFGLANCALRHGGLAAVDLRVDGPEISVSPITEAAAPIVLGDDLRDLGAAIGVRVVTALAGSVELDGETLRVRLPAASGEKPT